MYRMSQVNQRRGVPEEAPTISVIIPTYNRERLLREALGSVFSQTFTSWELIVADDGSTDNTLEYLATLTDPRVHVVALERQCNMARMRNAAVAGARGEWLAFLDSDDLWLPTKLELQLSRLAANPNCDWSCTGFGFIDTNGRSIPQRSGLPYEAHSGLILERLLQFTATATIQSLMVRRSVFEELGGFDESFLTRADYDLELRLAARGEICALPEVLVVIRQHESRTSDAERLVNLFRENERVFRKAATTATSERARALCIRQCATQLVRMAQCQVRGAEYRAALVSSLKAVRLAPFSLSVWRSIAGVIVRASFRSPGLSVFG
jgi:glycosyltransferase involved in cell wall biosynthesis